MTVTERDTVVSFDPGVTTGIACRGPRGVDALQMDFENLVQFVAIFKDHFLAIVCERYTVTAETLRKSRQTASLEIIGHLRAVSILESIPFVLQSPADAKRFATDEKLALAGWKLPSTQDHANDALRHLMLYLVKTRQMDVPR